MSILKFLGLDDRRTAASPAQTEAVRQIVDALEHLDPEKARYVAKFAYILSRVASADRHISSEETRAMERIVMEKAGLPEEQAIIVVQMAKSRNLVFGGTEDFLITREFGRIASREQRLGLLDCLFAVSAAEKSISQVEDNEIRKITSELLLEHRDFIAVRSGYRDHLAVLQDPSEKDPSEPE